MTGSLENAGEVGRVLYYQDEGKGKFRVNAIFTSRRELKYFKIFHQDKPMTVVARYH